MGPVYEAGEAKQLSATGNVYTDDCALLGFYVASTTAGTIVVRRGGASGDNISDTITPAVGFHPFPAACPGGCHVTLGGTIEVTFFYVPTN